MLYGFCVFKLFIFLFNAQIGYNNSKSIITSQEILCSITL